MTALARMLACAVTVGVSALLCVAPAVAAEASPASDPTARAEALGGQARDAYRAGRYDRAIELYLDAYETAASAGFLFNIAYVYDKKTGDMALAHDYYERAAAFDGADPALVAKARARAAELAAILTRPPDTGPDGPGGTGPDGTGTDGTGPGGTGPDGTGPDGKGPGGTGTDGNGPGGTGTDGTGPGGGAVEPSSDPLPWIVMGTGAALLGGGVALGAVASGTESDFHAATDNDTKRSLQSTGKGQAAGADVMMLVGVAVVGTGLALLLLDDDEGGHGTVHVTPTVMGGGAGVVIGGAL